MMALLGGRDAAPGEGRFHQCVLQEWQYSPLWIARFSGGASGFVLFHVNRSHRFLIAPTVGRLALSRDRGRMVAVADYGEVRGSVWVSFIIFPLRPSAGGHESALEKQVVRPDIPKAPRDMLRWRVGIN